MQNDDDKKTLRDDDIRTQPKYGEKQPEKATRELNKNNPSDFKNADGNDPVRADGRDPYKGSTQDKDKPEDVTNIGDAVW